MSNVAHSKSVDLLLQRVMRVASVALVVEQLHVEGDPGPDRARRHFISEQRAGEAGAADDGSIPERPLARALRPRRRLSPRTH